jgi:membrane protein DedA with SNARE-associated domain
VEGFLDDYGLVFLFLIIALQAAGGAGLPGKTALVVAAILAADGRWSISSVIAVATVAVIVGGYTGYAIGRLGARRLLARQFLAARLKRPLEMAERFFDEHGPKAVFLARFIPGLKVVAALAAGTFGMRWSVFAFWHALAAIAFALVFGLTAFWAGRGAIELVEEFGLLVLVPIAALAVLAWVAFQAVRRRRGLRTT